MEWHSAVNRDEWGFESSLVSEAPIRGASPDRGSHRSEPVGGPTQQQETTIRNLTKALLAGAAAAALLTGCTSESVTVDDNMTTAADNFEVLRRIVFFNGITDTYLLEIQGFCSLTDEGNQLEVICKVGKDSYEKDMLGLSDNVSYFAEQLEPEGVDPYHHRVIFRPESIVPDVDLQTSGG